MKQNRTKPPNDDVAQKANRHRLLLAEHLFDVFEASLITTEDREKARRKACVRAKLLIHQLRKMRIS